MEAHPGYNTGICNFIDILISVHGIFDRPTAFLQVA
jgi:hypothetical protein